MFLYTNNKLPERGIKKTLPFKIAPKRIKSWGINLTKRVKGLYLAKHKTLMGELKTTETGGRTDRARGLEELT